MVLISELQFFTRFVSLLQGEDAKIHFPANGKSDIVTIRGTKAAVKKAKKALLEEADSLRIQSFSETVQTAPVQAAAGE